ACLIAAEAAPAEDRCGWWARSPDLDALVGFEVELGVGLDAKGLVPGVEVADGQGPVAGRGVNVGFDLLAQGGLAHLRLPGLGKRDEEALVAGEAVDDWCRLA